MSNILTIIKKELSRVFKDKRLVFTSIIMPGLLIYLMYSIMGNAIQSISQPSEEDKAIVVTVNAPESFFQILDNVNNNYENIAIGADELEEYKTKLLNGEVDSIVEFPNDFNPNQINPPLVNNYYNPSSTQSESFYNSTTLTLNTLLNQYVYDQLGNPNLFIITPVVIMDDQKMVGKVMSMLLPFLIIVMLFSGAMSVCPESIAGDKERGTMATLLVTPIKRSEIALGKISALSVVSILSAISSFVGIILSLPKLMGFDEGVDTNIYGVKEYLLILLVLIVTVLIIVGMICVLSAYSKNVKESSMLVLPLYFVVMALGIASMFSTSANTNTVIYFIPIYNSLQSLIALLTFDFNAVNLIICLLSNVVYTVLLVLLLSKMFNNEKIMFAK